MNSSFSFNDKDGQMKDPKMDARLLEQLMRLEKEHSMMLNSLKQQRLAATRWMKRQQVRLTAQAVEIQKERAVIAQCIDYDERALNEAMKNIPE
jgi:hypothetical protein